jgi:hypothetical protein
VLNSAQWDWVLMGRFYKSVASDVILVSNNREIGQVVSAFVTSS